MEELRTETRTIIIYEAPHRLLRTLLELREALGNRRITICRELTKKHETAFQTTLSDAVDYYTANPPKGECVIVMEGRSRAELQKEAQMRWEELSVSEHVAHYIESGMDRKEAMKQAAKDEIMERFGRNEIQILVSTTVIEVGIDVPNATVMMIENAERFGLAQLHQLRGRVGRGKYQSYCIFISTTNNKGTMERLQVLNKSNDGFFISSEDMRLRGPGDLFGIRQSGQFQFQIGDIYQDATILQSAQQCASQVYKSYIQNGKVPEPQYAEIWQHYEENIARSVDFISI